MDVLVFVSVTAAICAYVALGGNADRSGTINAERLRKTCQYFQLTIDIDKLIKQYDTDGSGEIDYDEFKAMLTSSA